MINLDAHKSDASFALDFLRAAAAQAVCVGHAAVYFDVEGIRPHFHMQNLGVILFFLISGVLIAYTLVNRSKDPSYGFASYTVDRIARIHSGLLPCLVVILLIDGFLLLRGLYDFPNYLTLKTFIANVFQFQGYGGVLQSQLLWPQFGSGAPLWTLSIEFHIYLFVGAVFFLLKGARSWPILLVVALFYAQMPLQYLIGSRQPDVGTALFAIWLAGFGLAFMLGRAAFRIPPLASLAVAVVSGWLLYKWMLYGKEYRVELYPLLVLCFASVLLFSLRTNLTHDTMAARVTRRFADYSYTLYLIHHTIVYALFKLWPGAGMRGALTAIVLSNLVAYPLAYCTEMRHKSVARRLKSLLGLIEPTRHQPLPVAAQIHVRTA
jgi:peptidoglycan/LPS O-acetylase OafA/YrhL